MLDPIICVALVFLDSELLRQFLDLRICTRNPHAQIETLNQQNKDKKQEYEINRRICSREVRERNENLREQANNEKQTRKAKPKNGILQTNLGITNLAADEHEGEQGGSNQHHTKLYRHRYSLLTFLLINWINRIEIAMRNI